MSDVVLLFKEIIAVSGDSLLIAACFVPDISECDKENIYYEHSID
jgi:hypothetical protein